MKLESVVFHRAGLWAEELRLDFGPGMTLVLGDNEAGKSTTLRALEALFFGVNEALVSPCSVGSFRASVFARDHGSEALSWLCQGRRVEPEGVRERLFPPSSRPRFEALFRLGHTELRAFEGSLGAEGALGRVIHAAEAGVSASALEKLQGSLFAKSQELLGKSQRSGKLRAHIASFRDARLALAAKPDLSQYELAHAHFVRLEEKAGELGEHSAKLEDHLRELSGLIAFKKVLEDLLPLEAALDARGGEPRRRAWATELEAAHERAREASSAQERRQRALSNAEATLAGLGEPSALLPFAGEIRGLHATISAIQNHRERLAKIESERREARRDLERIVSLCEGETDRVLLDRVARERSIEEPKARGLRALLMRGKGLEDDVTRAEARLREAEGKLQKTPEPKPLLEMGLFERARATTRDLQTLEGARETARAQMKKSGALALSRASDLGLCHGALAKGLAEESPKGLDAAIVAVFALSVRERGKLEALAQERAEKTKRAEEISRRIEEKLGALSLAEGELTSLRAREDAPPHESALNEARELRDAHLFALEEAWAKGEPYVAHLGAVRAHREHAAQADELADLRFSRASLVSDVLAAAKKVGELEAEIESAREKFIAAEAELRKCDEREREAWPFLAEPPRDLGRWLDRFEELKQALVAAKDAAQEAVEQEREHERKRLDLVSVFEVTLPELGKLKTGAAIEAAIEEAAKKRSEQNSALAQAAALHQEREGERERAKDALSEARLALESWSQDWERATEALPEAFGRSREAIEASLDAREKIEAAARALDKACGQSKDVQAAIDAFDEEVQGLRGRLHEGRDELPQGLSPLDLVAALHESLEEALAHEQTLRQAKAEVKSARDELHDAVRDADEAHGKARELWREGGREGEPTSEEVAAAIEEAAQAWSLVDAIKGKRSALGMHTPEGREKTLARLAGRSLDVLEAEFEAANERREALREELAKTHRELGVARNERDRLASDDDLDLAQELEIMRQRVLESAAEAAAVEAARFLVQKAKERAESRARPLVDEASGYFAALTRGQYSGLFIDEPPDPGKSPELVALLAEGGGDRKTSQLSDGTLDQIWLALRLAVARRAAVETPMPLILDDIFVHFDDERTEAALQLLGELSAHLQIILFTHHDQVARLAKRAIPEERLHLTVLARPEQRERAPLEDEGESSRIARPEAPARAESEERRPRGRAPQISEEEGSALILEALEGASAEGLGKQAILDRIPEERREDVDSRWPALTERLKAAEAIVQTGRGRGVRYTLPGPARAE